MESLIVTAEGKLAIPDKKSTTSSELLSKKKAQKKKEAAEKKLQSRSDRGANEDLLKVVPIASKKRNASPSSSDASE